MIARLLSSLASCSAALLAAWMAGWRIRRYHSVYSAIPSRVSRPASCSSADASRCALSTYLVYVCFVAIVVARQ